MSDPFLSSDDYDERAHQLYNEGQYDEAIDTLREGLGLYPHAVELLVGMGYARLAREEFAWARQAFEEARGLDPDHEDTLAGLGEVLLKFGERATALACFDRVLALGFQDDHDLMLQIGRALELDPSLGEARIYLANLLYDRGEYEAALFHLERTGPEEHYDALAIWRLVELKKSVYRLPDDDPELVPWNDRLNELAGDAAPEDLLLSEIGAMTPDGQIRDPRQIELFGTLLTELQGMKNKAVEVHRVSTVSGATYVGTWEDIVRQMKDDAAEWVAGSLEEYMEASAKRWRKQTGAAIPATDPESFLRASADAGVLRILH